jgi:nucleoside-diphosphate-sugar epimerase
LTPSIPRLVHGTTVAVTGATGFIGGRLVEVLASQGADVICLARSGLTIKRLEALGAKVRIVDLTELTSLSKALEGVELVFHSAFDPTSEVWNFRAMGALIAASQVNQCRRFVHLSSFVVYELPTAGELTEQSPQETSVGGYSHTKRKLESMILEAARQSAFPGTILQPTIVYGPRSRPWTIEPADMLRYGTLILPDHGEGTCNAVYVDDVVSAMVLATQATSAVGERFLISGPNPITWCRFFEEIAKAANANLPTYLPFGAIARQSKLPRKILRIAKDPFDLLRVASRIGPCRGFLSLALKIGPKDAARRAEREIFGPVARRIGRKHMPSLSHADFLSKKFEVHSRKARMILGYNPRVDFCSGMIPTREYLRGAYSGVDLGEL